MKKRVHRAPTHPNTDRLAQQLTQAVSFHSRGDNTHAERLLERLVREHPGEPRVLSHYGCFLKATQRPAEARTVHERLVRIVPDVAAHWADLGAACQDAGDAEGALKAYRQAVTLDPSLWQAYFNIARLLEVLKDYEKAASFYQYALKLNADYAPAWFCLGNMYSCLNRPEQANLCFAESAQLEPSAAAYCNLAQGLISCHQTHGAMAAAQKAIELDPKLALAHSHLGRAHAVLFNVAEAKKCFEAALQIDPNCPPALSGMAGVLGALCYWDESIAWYMRALETNEGANRSKTHSEMLLNLGRVSSITPARMLEEHHLWQEMHGSPAERYKHTPAAQEDPNRKLRVGFVSGDFRAHSVKFFIAPVLRGLDRRQFAVTCYSNSRQFDSIWAELRGVSDEWREIYELSDAQMAEQVRRDGIDILVDLSGHTYANRLLVFDRKPAPVQVTYLGYGNTTGLDTIDYWLTDWTLHPEGTTQLTSERIWRLPRCWIAYEPLADSPEVSEKDPSAPLTFISFNAFQKIGAETLRLWASVLEAVPESRLLIKSRGLSGSEEQALQLERLQEAGVPSSRVTLMGYVTSTADHLALYGAGDIALDSSPYSGATTTVEALWMGVPVVTLPGEMMASRMSASLLHGAGLDEFIARDADDFVRIAAGLAGDGARRGQLRRELRARVAQSPVCDGANLAQEIGAAFREMWAEWRRAAEPAP